MAIIEADVTGGPAIWRPDTQAADAGRVANSLGEAGTDVVIDLTGYEPHDTADLGALVTGVRHFFNEGGHAVFLCPQPGIRILLKTTGIDRIAPVVPSLAQAEAELNK